MLTKEENERLTRVGPGTPMGMLLRRYWHPIAGSVELNEQPTKAVRLLGEDLVLYRDGGGALGLVQRACPHRGVNLKYGMVEEHGLRCPYHGWLFDETGRCLEQPFEDTVKPDSDLKQRADITAYAVQEYAGLVWAYLGPAPAPLLPHWDILTWENCLRHIGFGHLPCNWLHTMEKSVDPIQSEWLHAEYHNYILRRMDEGPKHARVRHSVKIRAYRFEHGIVHGKVLEGGSEDDQDWKVGHPLIFPNILRVSTTLQIRVPVDDTNTLQVMLWCYFPPDPSVVVPPQESVPVFEIPLFDERGEFILDTPHQQDFMVMVTAGPVADRTRELLGESDRGLLVFRELIHEQLAKLETGEEPINVFRDPARASFVALPCEERPRSGLDHMVGRYSPIAAEITAMLQGARGA